jgi:hypothetical protein
MHGTFVLATDLWRVLAGFALINGWFDETDFRQFRSTCNSVYPDSADAGRLLIRR